MRAGQGDVDDRGGIAVDQYFFVDPVPRRSARANHPELTAESLQGAGQQVDERLATHRRREALLDDDERLLLAADDFERPQCVTVRELLCLAEVRLLLQDRD